MYMCDEHDSRLRKIPLWGLYLTAFSASLSISGTQIGLGITLISWLMIMFAERRVLLAYTPMTKPIIFYMAALFISAIFGANQLANLTMVVKTQWIVLIFFATVTFVRDIKTLKRLIYATFAGGVVASLYGIAQYVMNGLDLIRPVGEKIIQYSYTQVPPQVVATGFFRHHLTYAEVLLFSIFLSLSILFWRLLSLKGKEGRGKTGAYLIIFLIIEMALFFSLTRSSWLAFLGTLILMIIFLKEWSLKLLSLLSFLFFIGIIFYRPSLRDRAISTKKLIPEAEVVVTPTEKAMSKYIIEIDESTSLSLERIISFYNRVLTSITSAPRFYIWQSGLKVFAENPITGVGPKNWAEAVKPYREIYWQRYERNYNVQAHAHNNLIQQAATGGIIGLAAFIYVWIVFFAQGFKIYSLIPATEYFRKGVALGVLSGITAFHVAGMFECTYNDSEVAMLLWFVAGLMFVIAHIGREIPNIA